MGAAGGQPVGTEQPGAATKLLPISPRPTTGPPDGNKDFEYIFTANKQNPPTSSNNGGLRGQGRPWLGLRVGFTFQIGISYLIFLSSKA